MRHLLILVLLHVMLPFCYSQFKSKPLWHDEFDKDGIPNKKMWAYSTTKPGTQKSGYCNDIKNAYVKDGLLHLHLYKDDKDSLFPYKSGRLIARTAYKVNNGKLVIRAKAPAQPGVWPALWLRTFPGSKKAIRGELDMMEYINSWKDSTIQVNYHLWGDFRGKKENHVQYPKRVNCKVSDWHVYELDLLGDSLVMKIDDNQVYQVKKGEKGEEWPFDYPYQLMLAFAYGGWGAAGGCDDSRLPAEFLIDYVRYYELKKH